MLYKSAWTQAMMVFPFVSKSPEALRLKLKNKKHHPLKLLYKSAQTEAIIVFLSL
jgi:hypothetical protein